MGVSLLEVENAMGAIGQLDRASPVILGDLILSGLEVPDELTIGGKQILVVHRLLGGGRVIDAVGNDPARLTLRGRFVGPMATRRARRVEAMRESARVFAFSIADLSAQVWIAEFSWSYQARGTICPYRLVLEREVAPPTKVLSSAENADLDMRAGLASISNFLGEMATAGWIGSSMISSVARQAEPVAKCLGLGGAVSRAQASLGKASALWQMAMNVSRVPMAMTAVSSTLSLAKSDLLLAQQESARALEQCQITSSNDLITLAQNAGAVTMSVEAESYVSRARRLIGD